MSFFARCISGSSLKGLVDQGDEDLNTTSTTNTPNDTAHGGSKFGSLSWKRLSTRSSRSSLNSPKKPFGSVSTPPPSLASSGNDGGAAAPRPSMEPVMERTRSALTDLEAVKFLIEDWSHKHWRPATPQDQECFDRIDQRDIKPLVALGEGAYGSVNLCRIPMSRLPCGGSSASAAAAGRTASATGHIVPRHAMSQRELATSSVPVGPSAPSNAPSNRSSTSGSGLPQLEQPQQTSATAGGSAAAAPTSAHRPHHQRAASSGAAFGQRSRTTSLNGGIMEDVPAIAEEPGAGEVEASGSGGRAARVGPGTQPPVAEGSAGSTVAEEAVGSSPATLSSSSAASGSSGPGAGTAELDPGAKRSSGGGAATSSGADEATAGASALDPASSVNDPQLIVAVKRVPLGWNQERELMQLHRCQQCPFIVRLFGFVEDGDEHCSYVMEWAEGGDLAGMLMSLKDRRGANKQRLLMSEASARYYMGCLLLALEFLHSNGLLHRDIKPSNLLLTSDGTAKLADLGFTVALDANGRTVGCCGTTGYIAPEVYAYGTGSSKTRTNYGIPADIWSAAATLYQVLTGSVVTDRPEEVLRKGWRPPTHPRFSPQLQDLLNRMLAAKPSNRPQTVASVMRHAWFAGFDWAALREGRMTAPYVPRERRHTRPDPPTGAAAPTGAGAAAGAAPAGAAGASAHGAAGGPGLSRHSSGAGMSTGSSGGPPPASPGGQRLATVMERIGADGSNRGASEAAEGGTGTGTGAVAGAGEEIEVPRSAVQRSALSLRDEASVHRGREGLVRDGSSFETALDTVPTAEAEAAAAHSIAVAALAGAAAAGSGHGGLAHGAAAADGTGNNGGNGHSGPLQHGHGRVHAHVRFAMGVAECA